MASSGSFNTTGYEGRYLTFSWTETSQNIANNTTTISWTLKGAGTGQSGYYHARNIKVTIAGTTAYYQGEGTSSNYIKLWDGTTVASGTYTFTHADDGTKSFTASVEAGIYVWAVNCTGSKTFTLDTIARKSTLTASNGTLGTAQTLTVNRQATSLTHTITYKCGSASGTIVTKSSNTSISWTPPLSLASQNTTGTSVSITLTITTYSGSTSIGSNTKTITGSIPSSVKPSLSVTLEDTTGIDDIYGSPVKGLSKIKITPTVTTSYGSPIASYTITANGVTYNTSTATTGFLTTAGSSKVTVTVKDKRGRSATWTYTMTVLDYTSPTVSSLTVKRCDADGTENDQGEYVQVTFSAAISSMSSKNTASFELRHKKSGDSTWSTKDYTASGKYTITNQTYIFAADGNHSYDVEVIAVDRHSTITRATSVSTAFTLYNCHPSGTGWRFGGVAELENTLQNDLVFVQTANQYAFSSIGAASTDGYILMARITVTATNSDTPITFVFSRRRAQAPMTVHVLFKSTADTDPGLSSIKYEGDNFDAYLTSPTASVWDLYVKKVNSSDTVTLNRWHTSARQMKRVNVEFVGNIESTVPLGRFGYYHATPLVAKSIIDCFMPVGYILTLYSQADPNDMYPGTTWVRMANTFLWGCDAEGDIGITGGEKTHALTVNELPAHSHGSVYSGNVSGTKTHAWLASGGSAMAYGTVSAGSGAAHNNMPPYTQVAFWRRTA